MEIQVTNDGLLIKDTRAIHALTKVLKRAFAVLDWEEIKEPTISQVSEYVGISTDKIKKDLASIDCPLKRSHKGGRGRKNEMRFFKSTVDHYKIWLLEKQP